MGPNTYSREWNIADDDFDTAMAPAAHGVDNGASDVQLDDPGHPQEISTSKSFEEVKTDSTRDRQVKPNKVYIGGLPDHTRPDDLRNCFGKLGSIVTIELKLGYGFVEFDSREAAEESVARYHEGYFMGNKIRVEPSHSRGRTFKRPEDPGACFNCGENGHWARECTRPSTQSRGGSAYDQQSHDRSHHRDYHHTSRDSHSNRDDHSKHPSSKESRYYDAPSGAAPPAREHRRAVTPPRDRRDYSSRRDHDDHHMRSPAPQPVSRHDRTSHRGTEREYSSSGAQAHREQYDRYDRRNFHSDDRSASYATHSGRPRTPPGPPPVRDDFDKGTRTNYSAQEPRRRAGTPPPPYPGNNNANGTRYRRRSLSPPPRYGSGHGGSSQYAEGERYSTAPREGTRVRDYYRSSRGEDSGHRRS